MNNAPWVCGFSASHNGAVCLMHGDEIVAAIQEERLNGAKRSRIKRLDESLAFKYCLDAAGIRPDQLASIVGCYFAGEVIEGGMLADGGWAGQISWIPHHLGHAIGVCATSGMTEAAVLVIDGQGGLERYQPTIDRPNARYASAPGLSEYSEIMSIYHFADREVRPLEKHYGAWMVDTPELERPTRMPRFASLGGMYSAVTTQIFGDPMDPGKVMGLAAYGASNIPIEEFFTIAADGHYDFSGSVCARFPHAIRWPNRKQEYESLACSVQAALEVGVMHMARRAADLTGCDALCYAGGVALNSVANERLIQSRMFTDVFVMPAAEDSGTAVGAAVYGLGQLGYRPSRRTTRDSLGRCYSQAEIQTAITNTPCIEIVDEGEILESVVDLLVQGKVVGWFQRGCELGPRALGQRSILADARHPGIKEILNARVKHREVFRPFAPAILAEEVSHWFELGAVDRVTPFMLRAPTFRKEKRGMVPGAVHHDGTGRLQTVASDADPMYRELLLRFHARTQVPLIINTSFNVMGEPIVETPDDALWCLLCTDLDYCVLDKTVVKRAAAFRSVLDLVPHFIAEDLHFIIRPTAGVMSTELNASSTRMSATCRGRWGVWRMDMPLAWLPMIELMNGRRSGAEIVQEVVSGSVDHALSVQEAARAIRIMRRGGAIAFGAAESAAWEK